MLTSLEIKQFQDEGFLVFENLMSMEENPQID